MSEILNWYLVKVGLCCQKLRPLKKFYKLLKK